MSDEEFSDGEGSDDEQSTFPLHDAAQAGDAELLRELLKPPAQAELPAADDMADPADILARYAAEVAAPQAPNPDKRDFSKCTPLHVALLHGQPEAARALLECGASTEVPCEGSPPLHVAVCVAAHPAKRAFAEAAVALLLRHGADPFERDDNGRTALHWAAQLDFLPAAIALLEAAERKQAQLQAEQQAAVQSARDEAAKVGADVAAAATSAAAEHDGEVPPALAVFQDKHGCTALHLAARQGHAASAQLLLDAAHAAPGDGGDAGAAALARAKNKAGQTALHLAALAGSPVVAAMLARAAPEAAHAKTKLGLTPADVAQRRRHDSLAAALRSTDPASELAAGLEGRAADGETKPRTLLVAPPECLVHYTCPAPITRGTFNEAPPENMERLSVLTKPEWGILRTAEFEGRLAWDEGSKRAALADVMRVHDWNYVRRIQMVCDSLPDDPEAIGQLDGDTAVSRGTFRAALAGAGAVCTAVDAVMEGAVSNAFCAVRPPGHHAGPLGVVTNKNDPNGSHGFCLFNNAAIGAAYAMNVYRHAGVRRVAIVDFDVHHGNGTEACVTNTIPSTSTYSFRTPFSEGTQTFQVWQPWLDSTDKECIFFASVQGYGPKAEDYPVFVYPGSGATCDSKELAEGRAAAEAAAKAAAAAAEAEHEGGTAGGEATAEEAMDVDGGTAAVPAQQPQGAAQPAGEQQAATGGNAGPANGVAAGAGGGQQHAAQQAGQQEEDGIEEDPDREFVYKGGQAPPAEGPRVIDVGIPGFGPKVALWRRAWRDKILPALAKFKPDMIFVCAGFDAHRKDEINFRYIGVTERDFEWLTDQLVQVANRCCNGRIVSMLEGGYRIQGALVSAFARSVAAHVHALAEPNQQVWDPADARAEREHEKRVRAEQEAKKQAERVAKAKARQAAIAARLAAAQAHAQAQATEQATQAQGAPAAVPPAVAAGQAGVPVKPEPAVHAAAEDGEDGGGRKRRRRASETVDYVALNKQLEAEAAARRTGG